jgi:hypothetical protein
VQTDRTFPYNKPDIIICDTDEGKCMSIDVAISHDGNLTKKQVEKILKHKVLKIEIQRMWNVKAKMIPVIRGVTGTISKSHRPVAYPGIFSGGGSTNSVEDRGQRLRGSGGGGPLVWGSGDSCNLVQEILLHILKFP